MQNLNYLMVLLLSDFNSNGIDAHAVITHEVFLPDHEEFGTFGYRVFPAKMLEEAGKPDVGRSEALRRSMLALINDTDRPYYAHPLFWAPFVVVGEGR